MKIKAFIFMAFISASSAYASNNVKAKILTGFEISENERIPLFIEGDYSFLDSTNKKISLKNCFYFGEAKMQNNRVLADVNQVTCKEKQNVIKRNIKAIISEDDSIDTKEGILGKKINYSEKTRQKIIELINEISNNDELSEQTTISIQDLKDKLIDPKLVRVESGKDITIKIYE
ncbi:MAG: hypothetical protein K2X69_13010 [Silvanigrellaceae bacterium]|nr:hypothetical protein [Silvanigrellaceae bacterium]